MAYVINPDGTPGEVPDKYLQRALEQGYKVRPPDPDELARAEAADSPVAAGIEGIVRNVVPVAGQEVLTQIEEGYTGKSREEVLKAQSLRKEENPIVSAIGSGVGFAAGPGKVLKPLLAPLRAAGLLGKAAAGAAENGIFGMSEAVNESVIDQTPLTAEKLAASTAAAALTGGSLEFGMGAIAKGTSAVLQKAASPGLRDAIKDAGNKLVGNQLVSKAALKKYGTAKNLDEIINFAQEQGIITKGSTFDTVAEAAAEKLKASQPVYDYVLDAAQKDAPPTQVVIDKFTKAVRDSLKEYKGGLLEDQAAAVEAKIADVLEPMRKAPEGITMPSVTYRQIHDMQSQIFGMLPANGQYTPAKEILSKARDAISSTLKEQLDDAVGWIRNVPPEMEALGVGKTGFMKKLSREYYYLKRLQDMAEDQAMGAQARGIGMKELAAGAYGAAYGGPVGAVAGVAAPVAGKFIRERGGFFVGGALRQMADTDMLGRVARSFERNVMQRLQTAPELLGPFRNVLSQAASQGAMDLMQTHVDLMNSASGDDYRARMGIAPSSPEEDMVTNQKLATYDAIQRSVQEYDNSMKSAIDGIFGAAPGRKGSSLATTLSPKEFSKTMTHIQDILRNPEGLYAKVPGETTGAAPMTSGQAAATLVRAAQFLDAKAPKDPNAGMPTSMHRPWEPSAADLDKFNRYKEAVEEPTKVLKNMASGRISKEQVEAIQAVYPAIYEDLRQQLSERMMTWKKPLTFQQKLAFSTVLGSQALGMSTQQMQILQRAQAASVQPPGGGSVKQDGRQVVNQEKNLETQSQRLEGR